MVTFVSLFRGINVGGNQKVPMNELKALHEVLGFKDVVTYIRSGNVVFTGENADVSHIATQISDAFVQQFGFQVSVMVRSATELAEIIARNPLQTQALNEPKWLVVLLLAACPASTALEDLQQAYHGPEEMRLIGQELYVFYPEGIGRSKLTLSLIEKKLRTAGTGRNWNTILQLQKLVQR